MRNKAAVERAMADFAVVFPLAASLGKTRSIEHPISDAEVNVLGTLNVLESARAHGLKQIVFSSSAVIFGEKRIAETIGCGCEVGVLK